MTLALIALALVGGGFALGAVWQRGRHECDCGANPAMFTERGQ